MTKQKVLSHKEVDNNDDLDYISENCNYCGEELIRVEDIFIGKDNDFIYCKDCAKYYEIDVVECKYV